MFYNEFRKNWLMNSGVNDILERIRCHIISCGSGLANIQNKKKPYFSMLSLTVLKLEGNSGQKK